MIICDHCRKKIPTIEEKIRNTKIKRAKKASWSDMRERYGCSGGRLFVSRKYDNLEMFVGLNRVSLGFCGDDGRWLVGLNYINETPENLFYKLKELL